MKGFTCAAGNKRPVEVRDVTYLPDSVEVRLPPEGLGSNTRTVRVQWVDYYRQ